MELDMRASKTNKTARALLKALAEGRSYEQILAGDQTLTSHDLFHTLSETSTSFWSKNPAPKRKPRQTPN
jgi:hypothetical protein